MKLLAFTIGLSIAAYVLFKSLENKDILTRDGQGITKYLIKLGYPKHIASGIAGNIYVESKYDPMAIGDNGQSFGLAQWHKSRWTSLKEWSSGKNKDFRDFKTQLDFIDWELNNTEKRAKQKLMETKNPYDAAFIFAKFYERPAFISEIRMTKAEELFNQI
jgi:hypothetical protein